MVRIEIKTKEGTKVARLNVLSKVTIVLGDSGTGKTKVCRMIKDALRYNEAAAYEVSAVDTSTGKSLKVFYATSSSEFIRMYMSKDTKDSVIIASNYVMDPVIKRKRVNIVKASEEKNDKHLVIFDRDMLVTMLGEGNLNVSMVNLAYSNGLYKFEVVKRVGK